MWASMSLSPKGTSVTTRFIRTAWGNGIAFPSYSARMRAGLVPSTRRSRTGTAW